MSPEIKEGAKIRGTISSIADYGLFVEVAKGVEGLVHISEISWTDRITDLHKYYKVGDIIDIAVVSLDKENRRMSLSVKQLEKDPWQEISEKFEVGSKIKGKITNIADFGIFVQLAPGVDGLVHISDLSWAEHIEHPADKYKKGDEVEALIIGINKQSKKISLGIKQLEANPWQDIEKQYQVGSVVEGEVSKITNFGAFIKLPTGIEGLVHISEFSDKPEAALKVGQKSQFKVVKINPEEQKIALTVKMENEKAPKVEKEKAQKTSDKIVRTEKAPKHEAKKDAQFKKEKSFKKSGEQSSSASKGKSQFQLELEKHASRNMDESE